jgi:putative ABC transport system permease protein
MIKNYLLTAFRNVLRYKEFSLINILGLSLSLAVCMLILVVIQDQYSYDKIHSKSKNIYRVQQVDSLSNISLNMASNPYALGVELRDHYAIAEEVVILNNTFSGDGLYEDTRLALSGLYASSAFFRVFDFKLQKGVAEGILDEPYTMVLSEETASKFFGDEDPVGKFIQIDSLGAYEVRGVVEKTKKKSHIQFEALVSLPSLEILDGRRDEPRFVDNWRTGWGSWIYLLLDEKADHGSIQEILDDISRDKYGEDEECNFSFYLQPFGKIVPGPLLGNELGVFLPKVFILFLGGLALVIIISAAFNYTSLSVARSMLRAREVGVRKTFGAFRSQVITQFLLEAIIISLLSLILAIAMLQFLLPAFSGMQMMSLLEIRPEQNITIYVLFLIFALLTGLLSGALPAVFISAFKPVNVLKGMTNIRFFSRLTLRKILLVTQFIFSMVFIISILLIFKQMNFMVNTELGFDAEVLYDINLQGKDFEKVKAEYSQLPEVVNICASSHVPAEGSVWGVDIRLKAEDERYEAHYFSAVGSPQDAIGTSLILEDSGMVEIIGVIRDFQYAAVFLNLRPMLLRYLPESHHHAFLRLSSADMTASMDKLENTWKKVDPYHDLDGDFMDGRIRYYYTFFEDIMYVVGFAALLAIIIASFGLLGMATYSTRTRTREIAIRKVFGAEAKNIVFLVSRSYLWLMLISALIGGVIAYLANNLWLQYLSKSVDFGVGTILTGVFFVVFVGLLTISSQTLKVAQTNPASRLKGD